MKTYINPEVFNLDHPDYLFLWFFHTKAMEMTFDEFYQYITEIMLKDRDFYATFLKPIALILGIKKSIAADKLYQKLRSVRIPPPSELMAKQKAEKEKSVA